jgi:hypothetical protein
LCSPLTDTNSRAKILTSKAAEASTMKTMESWSSTEKVVPKNPKYGYGK